MSKIGRRKFLSIATSITAAVGGMFALTPFVASFQPSKKAKALGAAIKINIDKIESGSIVKVIWKGMPVWILHRSEQMLEKIDSAADQLRDPNSELSVQPNFAKNNFRSIRPEFLVVEGVCTHLGCAPIEKFAIAPADMGPDWKGGFFCPCHGSKFDLSGRVFSGVPAPSNLRIPPHHYESDTTLIIGEYGEGDNV